MDSTVEPATVGFLLKEGRQQAGLSLKEVAARTCIRRVYLEALEADRFDLLPGEVYVQGFTRLYAKAAGLEEGPLLEQIRRQKRVVLITADEPESHAKRGMPVLRWALLALIVIVVAGGLLYRMWQAPAGEKVPAVAAQKATPVMDQEQASARIDDSQTTVTGAVPPSAPPLQ